MFVELIDSNGKRRYVNSDKIKEISYYGKSNDQQYDIWRITFVDSYSYFREYNLEKLIGQPFIK